MRMRRCGKRSSSRFPISDGTSIGNGIDFREVDAVTTIEFPVRFGIIGAGGIAGIISPLSGNFQTLLSW